MKLLKLWEKQKTTWFLICVLFGFFLLRLPSLFEPYWYGDEGIYEVIGLALRNGRQLYTGIWDNKPPLLYYIYAIFSGDQFWAKLLSLVAGIAAVVTFFCVARKLFPKNNKIIFVTTGVFAFLFATPLTEGNIANAENFMLFPILLAALFIIKATDKTKHQMILLLGSGLLLGIAFLIKIVALFDCAAFFLFFVIATYKNIKHIPQQILKVLPYIVGFFLPLFITVGFFALKGNLKDFIQSAFFSNVGYVGYGNYFLIPQGFLILKLMLLSLVVLFVFIKRKVLSKEQSFLILWLTFSVFNALFSQRSYTHYILVAIPSVCLYIGLLMQEELHKKFLFAFGMVALFILIISFPQILLLNRSFLYYQNYLQFVTNHKSVTDYYAFFDSHTPRDYDIATYINSKMQEKNGNVSDGQIFVWGNNGQIYKLTNSLPPGRYIVAYHINSKQAIDETVAALKKTNPQFVIVLPEQGEPLYLPKQYQEKLIIDDATIYEKTL